MCPISLVPGSHAGLRRGFEWTCPVLVLLPKSQLPLLAQCILTGIVMAHSGTTQRHGRGPGRFFVPMHPRARIRPNLHYHSLNPSSVESLFCCQTECSFAGFWNRERTQWTSRRTSQCSGTMDPCQADIQVALCCCAPL
ncbi:hypothetical protein P171DRAFT_197555 [Karstenula rhodostoma CBS 690.94]|uniref:Uncharacterized protein n=1 Tax=Karstenula rhodostoma CBS 690.94 TaxID=1392251 RepID=A0A9P4UF66_9PLEO|nr:hypothetical protein P171DRAFT_197555 [Karstenula rhodostoma CBS 690.94]